MRLFAVLLAGALVASASANTLLVEDGKEYVYQSRSSASAGTMDLATHMAGFSYTMRSRAQVSGRTMTIAFEDLKFTQYVGAVKKGSWPYGLTKETDVSVTPRPFKVTFDEDGLFQEMEVCEESTLQERNMYRGWVAQLQVNTGEIKKGNRGFRSTETSLQGKCDITYTVDKGAIRKSVSHTDDCERRVKRIVDDFRGYRCDDKKQGPNYPSSLSNTVYVLDRPGGGDKWQVKELHNSGSWIAQFYDEAGSTQVVHTNSTSRLVEVKPVSDPIAFHGGHVINDLSYEWSDSEYKWDQDRDLKAREPTFSTGQYFDDEPAALQDAIRSGIKGMKPLVLNLDKDAESLKKAHRHGINNLLVAFYPLDYASLKELADEFYADKSEAGVSVYKVYTNLLVSAGTTASALVVKDLILENKFANDRDAARALTGISYHIRRPNTQLVREFETLLTKDDLPRFVKMAVPLSLGSLIRVTCMRTGCQESSKKCFKEFASTYVKKGWDRYNSATSREEKSLILSSLTNIRFGGHSKLLKDLIVGKGPDADDAGLRSQALWAAGWEASLAEGPKYFLPIFADRSQDHEIRIGALEMILFSRPTAADLATVTTVLYGERDYEVYNYAYTLFQRWAGSLDECSRPTRELVQYYLKFMRQFSGYEADMGFGVSKTYERQYMKKKYNYGGSYLFYVLGSKKSTLPLSLGFDMKSNMMGNYKASIVSVHLRLEGVSKAIVKKFKTSDPETWKTGDLKSVLDSMGVKERDDQPVRASVTVMLKGAIVFHRSYDETSTRDGGKIKTFLEDFKGLGDTYQVNKQHAVQIGFLLYEQPTNLGVGLVSIASVTTSGSLRATVKRGNHRGMLYRDIEYDAHFFTQGNRITFVQHPMRKASYGIVNDRIYHLHFPRKIVAGVNPIKREIKLSVSRPEYDNPLRIFMHSVNFVAVRGNNLEGTFDSLKDNCPTCENKVLVTLGKDNVKSRKFIDRENERRGSRILGEYFGCEMDINRGNTVRHLIAALSPYHKRPRTAYTSLVMGLRQIRTFFFLFPRTEQCGAQLIWSQSKVNPVKEIEISLRGNGEKNGERMFFRGRKIFMKALIKAKGEPADRSYRINLAYEFTPGNLQNKLKVQLNRAPVAALGVEPYSICLAFENKYPDFSKEFMDYDKSNDMKVSGKAMLQYGKGATCSEAEGEIQVKFEHSTTQAARNDLESKWYYQRCMATKALPQWASRDTLPATEACYMTVYDATSARRYTWDIDFVKLTPRLKSILNRIQTMVKAGLFPYWDVDPEEIGADGEIGPFLNVDATLKDNDKAMDIQVESRAGVENFNDVPLRLNWSKRLRNLKFTPTLKRLFDSKIINPCVVTTGDVRTLDNVTYPYSPGSCWTLASSACGPDPAYAVFTKSDGASVSALVYVGGHKIEFDGSGISVDGSAVSVADQSSHEHTENGVEIFKIFRWGKSYNVYSFLRVWVTFDGNYAQVIPAPSTRGQHCGLCGNYNRNKFDEFTAKDESLLASADAMVQDWKYQC